MGQGVEAVEIWKEGQQGVTPAYELQRPLKGSVDRGLGGGDRWGGDQLEALQSQVTGAYGRAVARWRGGVVCEVLPSSHFLHYRVPQNIWIKTNIIAWKLNLNTVD